MLLPLQLIKMGQISIVYGIIKINNIESFNTVIKALPADDEYPWIRPEMFNIGSTEPPYFYKSTIATFGATYKNLEDEISSAEFIHKFENILRDLDFDFARIRLETEFRGDFELFWGRKTGKQPKFYDNRGLLEHELWFFGYGFRNMFGSLIQHSEEPPPY